ncbi:MAG: hypothetical protein IJN11_00330 [Oscillospiraceae bacterium]|nr:hypothetical protein [Oscillospiraceae bacterium]
MRNRKNKITAVLASAVLLMTGSMTASASGDAMKIVVLGDGISSGAKLASGAQSYVQLVESYTGADVTNYAVENNTMAGLLTQLEDAAVRQSLQEADVILVTIGTHDALDPFMAKTHEFMTQFGFAKFADVFTAQLEDYGLTETTLQTVYQPQLKEAAIVNRQSAADAMHEVTAALSGYEGQVVFQTVYNPIDTIENLDELTSKRRLAYNTICNPVSAAVNGTTDQYGTVLEEAVNTSIYADAAQYGFTVVDTFNGFLDYAYKYVNLADLDVHPTAEGHRWMATQVLASAGLLKKGDVDASGEVNAADAAEVLVHAATVGAGEPGTLTEGQLAIGNVIADENTDASDAARILVYAAEEAAGNNPTWD